jgi:16S rRNA (guanine(966)-N(2))-methyltransferase RsmD
VRPTSDRVREALFQISQVRFGQPAPGFWVLDLFCGSGALGLEAISRGADGALMVDSSKGSLSQALENAKAVGVSSRIKAVRFNLARADAARFFLSIKKGMAKGQMGPFSMVFMDPPYGKGLLQPLIQAICEAGLLHESGVLICEAGKGEELPGGFARDAAHDGGVQGLSLADERVYGQTKILFYRPLEGLVPPATHG